jgi:uncharacterized membrane protein YfcA
LLTNSVKKGGHVHFDPTLSIVGLAVGFVVGLTGMGGGALMTPILVLFFGVKPLAAVSSDLVASMVMKPVGAAVHWRSGTVHGDLVRWLVVGSVPAAFAGVLVIRALGDGERLQEVVKLALGVALLLAAGTIVAKAFLAVRHPRSRRTGPLVVRPLATACVGAVGGLVVGMTSVGSGSLVIVMLLTLYPSLTAAELVGTDLVQAIPLVASASVAHLLFGEFHLDLTASLLLGAIPGVWMGARVSSRAPAGLVRRALAIVLMASGLKLIDVGNAVLGLSVLAAVVAGPPAWRLVKATRGLRTWPVRVPSA